MSKRKSDLPTLRMVVERGHLVPASAYEVEQLDAYSPGSEVFVDITMKRNLLLLKKYWAILDRNVKNAPTPWSTKEEADRALKLACGNYEVSRDVDGKWRQWPSSIALNEMDEEPFRRYYDLSMAVLARVTGADPEQFLKQYRHIPETETSGKQALSKSEANPGAGSASPVESPLAAGAAAISPSPAREEEAAGATPSAPARSVPAADYTSDIWRD